MRNQRPISVSTRTSENQKTLEAFKNALKYI